MLRAESGLYDGQGAEDRKAKGELSPSRKTGGWMVPQKIALANVQMQILKTVRVSGGTEGAVKSWAFDEHRFSAWFLDIN